MSNPTPNLPPEVEKLVEAVDLVLAQNGELSLKGYSLVRLREARDSLRPLPVSKWRKRAERMVTWLPLAGEINLHMGNGRMLRIPVSGQPVLEVAKALTNDLTAAFEQVAAEARLETLEKVAMNRTWQTRAHLDREIDAARAKVAEGKGDSQ